MHIFILHSKKKGPDSKVKIGRSSSWTVRILETRLWQGNRLVEASRDYLEPLPRGETSHPATIDWSSSFVPERRKSWERSLLVGWARYYTWLGVLLSEADIELYQRCCRRLRPAKGLATWSHLAVGPPSWSVIVWRFSGWALYLNSTNPAADVRGG